MPLKRILNERERPIFEALLAMGVDRECANAMMIARHGLLHQRGEL